jgi:large subunit ribosomal protein L6
MSQQAQALEQPQVKKQSRVGKRPIPIPKGVTVTVSGQVIEVQGPKGKLAHDLPREILAIKEGESLLITSSASGRDGSRLQGLGRALLASMIKGAAEGYVRILELVGTGYRAEVKGKIVTLQVGFSHPAVVELPAAVNGVVPPDSKGTQLVLSSADKAIIGQVAASIRALRPPEPYGGKGIRYRGEVVRKKAGKAGKGRTK